MNHCSHSNNLNSVAVTTSEEKNTLQLKIDYEHPSSRQVLSTAQQSAQDLDNSSSLKCPSNFSGHKTRWTFQEDERLKAIVTTIGASNDPLGRSKHWTWQQVAERLMTGRTAKQCRDRWHNTVKHPRKKGGWSTEDVHLLKNLHATFGPRWTTMTAIFKGRSDNDIKNKWYSMARTQQRGKMHASLAKSPSTRRPPKRGASELMSDINDLSTPSSTQMSHVYCSELMAMEMILPGTNLMSPRCENDAMSTQSTLFASSLLTPLQNQSGMESTLHSSKLGTPENNDLKNKPASPPSDLTAHHQDSNISNASEDQTTITL